MKTLLKKYTSVVRFVLLFLGVYLVLSLLYGFYLNKSSTTNEPDYITSLVAAQSGSIISTLGYTVQVIPNVSEPTMRLTVNDLYLAKVVEGCNGISIIILFIAFVVAFAEGFKKTIVFILAGSALIYSVNVIRIVILSIALYEYPAYKEVLHSVVFPAIIYGMVFILWMIWVRTLKLNA